MPAAIKVDRRQPSQLLQHLHRVPVRHDRRRGRLPRRREHDVEYQRQLAKEVEAISFLGADVVGYMEMENDGYGPTSAVQALVNALNLKDGAGTWAFVDPDAATGIADSAGTDAIKAGLLYRTASVTPVAGATFVDQNAIFQRRPVAQTFTTATGARLTVSPTTSSPRAPALTSGPDTDQGDGQSLLERPAARPRPTSSPPGSSPSSCRPPVTPTCSS